MDTPGRTGCFPLVLLLSGETKDVILRLDRSIHNAGFPKVLDTAIKSQYDKGKWGGAGHFLLDVG